MYEPVTAPVHEAPAPSTTRTRHGWVLLLLAASCLLPTGAHAHGGAPQTLWNVTWSARLIVLAEVERVTPSPSTSTHDRSWEDTFVATLRVRETWKGSAPPDARIEVHFNRFACPATPDYEVGETVIALLEEEHGHWWTVALAFGVRRPANDSETEDYRRVVAAAREAQDRWIQARIVGKTPDYGAIHRDWQVLAAAHPVTRWDAMHGLAPSLHERDDADSPRVSAMRQLTWAQRDALAKSLVERPSLDDGFMRMLTLLRGYASADVDRVTANVIETLNQREWVSHAALEGLTLLRERLGEAPSPPRPAPDFNKSFDERVQEASRAFSLEWLAFKQRHGLKPRPLPLPVRSQPSIP